MTSTSAHADTPLPKGASSRSMLTVAGPRSILAVVLFRGALILTAYLAGVHLAAAADDGAPEGVDAGALLGPACIGCHHGADDEQAPDDGLTPGATGVSGALARPIALAAVERLALVRHHDDLTATARQEAF